MDVFGVTVNCGSVVIQECKEVNLPWGEEWAFQSLLGELLETTGVLMNVGLKYAGDLSQNLTRAINALRCALVNIGDNAWNIVAAAWWTLVGVGQEAVAKEYLDQGYQWICTCQKDAESLIKALGADPNSSSSDPYANACSEKAAVAKGDAKAQREKEKSAELEKAAAAAAKAKADAATKAQQAALAGKSAAELEQA